MSRVTAHPAKQKPNERWAHLPAEERDEIDVFEAQIQRTGLGQVPEKVFLESRLRFGVYASGRVAFRC
jgi:hypothetical protein